MKANTLALAGGGIGAALLLYMISKNTQGESYGVAFAAPNPNAVAAAETGVVNEINANNALALGRAKIASDTVVALAATRASLLGAQLSANEKFAEAKAADDVSLQQTTITDAGATARAKIAGDATVAATQAAAQAGVSIAQTNADANMHVADANAAATSDAAHQAASASKTSSWLGAITNIIGGIFGF